MSTLAKFFSWLETLTWREGLILYFAVCVGVFALVWCIDWYFSTWEIRAIRRYRRRADAETYRRESLDLLKFPIERSVKRPDTFSLSRSMRDMKGRS